MKLAIIGGGAMGEAILKACLTAGVARSDEITVSDVAAGRRDHLSATYGVAVTDDNAAAVRGAGLVLLGVKPQEFATAAEGLKGRLDTDQTVLSIMAGVPVARIAEALGHEAVVRAMPNTAAFVAQAMSVWIAGPGVTVAGRRLAAELLAALGRELEVTDERFLDIATALSGSGPGYVFLFLEALIDAGVALGLERDAAHELATQTLLGTAMLASESDKSAAELREMVTSKGGTTAAGLAVLEEAGVRDAVVRAVAAAHRRAKEL